MIRLRNVAISVFGAVITAAPTYSQDLSRYREFQLGTNLPAVAKQIRVKPSDAKVIHERPAVIQESGMADSLHGLFAALGLGWKYSFQILQRELYRLVVTYDRERTEGLQPRTSSKLFRRSTEPPTDLPPKLSSVIDPPLY